MTAIAAKPIVELRPWREIDNHAGWTWVERAWSYLADDSTPKDEEAFYAVKEAQGAMLIGVWKDGDVGGMLINTPISPYVTVGHCVFSKRFSDVVTTTAALEEAKLLMWSAGFSKIWCMVPAGHRAVEMLIKRCGGIYEGLILNQVKRNGKMANMTSWAILK